MPYSSFVTFTGNGSTTTFSFAGIDGYLSTGYIKVYVDDVLVDPANYTIDVSGGNENVIFNTAPVLKSVIKIARETPQTTSGFTANIVDFSDGSVLTAADLDKGFTGMLHIVQEANDTGSGALGKTVDGLNWDAQKIRITNVAQGVDRDDAVTKAQLDAAQVYGNAVTLPQAWEFTGNGSTTNFTLNPLPSATDANLFIVEVGGILQRPSGADPDYEIGSSSLKFLNGAPANGVGIRVRNFGVARAALQAIPLDSITTDYIQDGAVTEPKLGAGAVTSTKLGAGAVTSAAIGDGSVIAGKLGTDAVVTANIANLQVTSAKLGENAVTTSKLDNLAVATDKLATGAVNGEKLADASINWPKFNSAATGGNLFTTAGADRFLKIAASGAIGMEPLTSLPLGGTATANVNMNGFVFTSLGLPPNTSSGYAVPTNWVGAAKNDMEAGYGLMNQKMIKPWITAGYLAMSGNIPQEIKDWSGIYSATPANSFDTTYFDLQHRSAATGLVQMVMIRPKTGFGTYYILGLADTAAGMKINVVGPISSASSNLPASGNVAEFAAYIGNTVGTNDLVSMAFFAARVS